ncbi:hypothetical protein ABZ749_01190 [Micromonospora sp. NPDC047753]|uniref:hypothetical protein n=1 Tax=Micromonospora sp. NPDC047753 TaxID=3154817 RepID=UPI0033F87680
MTLPTTNIPPSGPNTGGNGPQTFPATAITVVDLGCGHIGTELCDTSCDYWRGVARGEYPHPDTYLEGLVPHLTGLLPLTDPALGGVR